MYKSITINGLRSFEITKKLFSNLKLPNIPNINTFFLHVLDYFCIDKNFIGSNNLNVHEVESKYMVDDKIFSNYLVLLNLTLLTSFNSFKFEERVYLFQICSSLYFEPLLADCDSVILIKLVLASLMISFEHEEKSNGNTIDILCNSILEVFFSR